MKTDSFRPNRLLVSGQGLGLLLCVLLFVLSGCSGVATPAATQTAAPVAVENTPTPQDTVEPEVTAIPSATLIPVTPTLDEAASAELKSTVIAQLPPTATPASGESIDSFGGIGELAVLPLRVPAGAEPLWLVHSLEFPNFEQEQKHFLGIYSYANQTWKELAHHEIVNADLMMEGSIEQINISNDRIWLFVQSGVGAHSSCLEVISYDLGKLKSELESCNSSPLPGFVQDNDSDGIDVVISNNTDNYVFCYACSERFFSYALHHWDGKQFQKIDLQTPPSVEVSSPLYQLFEVARLGLWTETRAFRRAHETEIGFDSLARMYLYLFELHRDDFEEQAYRGGYPILDQLFYGDYAAAEAPLRAYTPEDLFVSPSPLISGTIAEGWDEQVTTWITTTVDPLISVNNGGDAAMLPAPIRDIDRLAAANYLYGWALSLGEAGPAAGRSYFEQAAKLKPDDGFYKATVDYLQNR